jgi:hypothetical protein
MANIVISAIDKRNTTYSKTIPFIKYDKPKVEIIGVDNGMLVDDTIVVFPNESIVKVKVSSPIGLTKVVYAIDGNEQVINLNGDKEYILNIRIAY